MSVKHLRPGQFLSTLTCLTFATLATDVPPPQEHKPAAEQPCTEGADKWPHLEFYHESDDEWPTGHQLHHNDPNSHQDRHAFGHGPRIGRRIASEFYNINHEDWRRRAIAGFSL